MILSPKGNIFDMSLPFSDLIVQKAISLLWESLHYSNCLALQKGLITQWSLQK